MKTSVVITSFAEPTSIPLAIEPIYNSPENIQLVIIAPDNETLSAAKDTISKLGVRHNIEVLFLKDSGNGKPAALNLAYENCNGDIILLTDGDVYLASNAINEILNAFKFKEIAAVGGHPISLEDRKNFFGYISHLFCEAAHQRRLVDGSIPMSGYIYAIRRDVTGIFPLKEELRAEDAYISSRLAELGYKTAYSPNAIVYVHFPKNLSDWIKQKNRSLGGNVQNKKFLNNSSSTRNMFEDLSMFLFPIKFAQNLRELLYSIALYPLRFYLWGMIYFNYALNNYSTGKWDRIESSKS